MLIYNENDFGVKSFQPYSKTCNFLSNNLPTTDSLFPSEVDRIVSFMPYIMKPDLG